jgi:DNA-binding CsgD family transcriptional regulator
MGQPKAGLVLLDAALVPLYSNVEALAILAYPQSAQSIKRPGPFLTQKIQANLTKQRTAESEFVSRFMSGRRAYGCRAFTLKPAAGRTAKDRCIALLLERPGLAVVNSSQVAEQYDLTPRERETIEYLMLGLSTQAISERMKISPNTVKTFLRLIMVKMGTTTRFGIVGRIREHVAAATDEEKHEGLLRNDTSRMSSHRPE